MLEPFHLQVYTVNNFELTDDLVDGVVGQNRADFSAFVLFNGLRIENKTNQTIKIYSINDNTSLDFPWNTVDLITPPTNRPFTFVRVGKGKTLVLKNDFVFPNNIDLYLYIRGAALPSLRVHFYKNNILQGATDISSISEPLIFNTGYEFNELHIEVLDDTNGSGIELGGISIT